MGQSETVVVYTTTGAETICYCMYTYHCNGDLNRMWNGNRAAITPAISIVPACVTTQSRL